MNGGNRNPGYPGTQVGDGILKRRSDSTEEMSLWNRVGRRGGRVNKTRTKWWTEFPPVKFVCVFRGSTGPCESTREGW